MIWPGKNNLFVLCYDLFVRRVLFVPAILKFYHYDYFLTHPYLGLYGAIPTAINLNIPEYHTLVQYQHEIGKIYYDNVNNNANTGYFIEGFARFGYMGLTLSGALLALILKQIDGFQRRNGYSLTICFFLYPIYTLADGQIIGRLFFGVWFFLLLIINLYSGRPRRLQFLPQHFE